ncbi:MAG: flagellar FlbD family protein [Bacillota bacterium]|jgi:flagellar protein FlbD|nr:flagellar FlbD family protein [Bacillota bacterium]HOK71723.1 flagellar FlbD family protein [Bacillota bacterium]HOL52082.1 flagellar FlbD family protein [Bacillota bacterium]HOO30828.1 flagellar FlbD family protein [Bacillota bacterium]HPQ02604.1 flagellar FlbD family protein [Bacillota bacterium]
MIKVTKLNGSPIHINAELIETIAATPDTVITLTNGTKLIVEESVEKVVDMIIRYHRLINRRAVIVRDSAEKQTR